MPKFLSGPYRRIELFEQILNKQSSIFKKLRYRFQYVLIRKPFSIDYEIELHILLSQKKGSRTFMAKPKMIKREVDGYASMMGIDKVRFFIPDEPVISNESEYFTNSPLQQRISFEYFAHMSLD